MIRLCPNSTSTTNRSIETGRESGSSLLNNYRGNSIFGVVRSQFTFLSSFSECWDRTSIISNLIFFSISRKRIIRCRKNLFRNCSIVIDWSDYCISNNTTTYSTFINYRNKWCFRISTTRIYNINSDDLTKGINNSVSSRTTSTTTPEYYLRWSTEYGCTITRKIF